MTNNRIRKRKLSSAWYPDNSRQIISFINKFSVKSDKSVREKYSAVVPHAGWDYSGSLAVKTISQMFSFPDTIVIVGGHLGSDSPVLYFSEDVYESSLGNFIIEKDFIRKLNIRFQLVEDLSNDNTVEILIPILKFFYPKSKILCLRVGPGQVAIDLGIMLYRISVELKQKLVVIGSTDLTHYGSNFSFSPHGNGYEGYKWVKDVNDSEIIEKMLNMDARGLMITAEKNYSACSSGAAAAVISYAQQKKVKTGNLVGYSNSYEVIPSDSFVGYVGITY